MSYRVKGDRSSLRSRRRCGGRQAHERDPARSGMARRQWWNAFAALLTQGAMAELRTGSETLEDVFVRVVGADQPRKRRTGCEGPDYRGARAAESYHVSFALILGLLADLSFLISLNFSATSRFGMPAGGTRSHAHDVRRNGSSILWSAKQMAPGWQSRLWRA
jgi:hypothetical protein